MGHPPEPAIYGRDICSNPVYILPPGRGGPPIFHMTSVRLETPFSAILAYSAYWRHIAAYSRQNPRFWELLPAEPGGRRKKNSSPGGEPPGEPGDPPGPGEFPHLTAPDLTAHRPSWGMFRLPLRLRSPPEARYRSTRPSGGARRSMTRGALRSERRSYAP